MHGRVQTAETRSRRRDVQFKDEPGVERGTDRTSGARERQPERAAARHREVRLGAERVAGDERSPGELAFGGNSHQVGSLQRTRRGQTSARDQRKLSEGARERDQRAEEQNRAGACRDAERHVRQSDAEQHDIAGPIGRESTGIDARPERHGLHTQGLHGRSIHGGMIRNQTY